MAINKHYSAQDDVFRHHNSPEDYLEYVSQPDVRNHHPVAKMTNDVDWAGVTYDDALIALERGDPIRTALANKMYDDITPDITLTDGRSIIAPAMVGFIPSIPSFIAGHPQAMLSRHISDDKSCYAPIKIYVETSTSSTMSAAELINRGVATLAFAMVMNTVRPIELYTLSSWSSDEGYSLKGWKGVGCHVVRIETRPLDISRAAWMLTDPAYARRISFTAVKHLVRDKLQRKTNYHDGMPLAWGQRYGLQYELNMREALQLEPQDMLIVGGYGGDELMLKDPKAWVNQMVNKHMENMA